MLYKKAYLILMFLEEGTVVEERFFLRRMSQPQENSLEPSQDMKVYILNEILQPKPCREIFKDELCIIDTNILLNGKVQSVQLLVRS